MPYSIFPYSSILNPSCSHYLRKLPLCLYFEFNVQTEIRGYLLSIKPLFKLDLNRSGTTDQVIDSFGLTDCQELTFFLYFDQSKTRHDRVKFIWSVNVSGHCAKFILSPVIILRQLCDIVNLRTALTGTPLLSNFMFCSALFDCQSYTAYAYPRPKTSVFYCIWLTLVSYEKIKM